MYKKIYFLILVIIILILSNCSSDILKQALGKDTSKNPPDTISDNIYKYEVTNYTIAQSFTSLDVTLSWTNPSDENFYQVIILRKNTDFPSGINDASADIIYSGNSQTYTDVSLTPNTTYYYKILTKNKSLLYSTGIELKKEIIQVVVQEDIYNYDVSGLSITQDTNNTNVTLSWTNPTDSNFDKVIILRKINNFSSGINDTGATLVYSGTAQIFIDYNLTVDTKYCYTVYSKSTDNKYSRGAMQAKDVVSISSLYNQDVSNLSISQGVGDTNLTLSWTNPTDSNFDKVIILRKTSNFSSGINDTSATLVYSENAQTFTDYNLTAGTKYCYVVYSKSTDNKYSQGAMQAKDVASISSLYNQDVSNLSISQGVGDTNLTLSWTNPTDINFSKIVILRKITSFPSGYNDSSASIVYSGTGTSFIDTGLTVGNKYCYIVYCKSNDSKYSNGKYTSEKIVAVGAVVYYYDVNDFVASQGQNNREIVLTWINPSDTAFVSVKLLRKTSGYPASYNDGTATPLYSGTNQKYTDSNLTPGTTYYYAIYTKNDQGQYSVGARAYRNIAAETGSSDVNIRRRSFFLIGGSSSYPTLPYSTTNLVAAVDMYDPVTDTLYANVATLPTPRAFCDIASANGKIYIFGGYSSLTTITNVVDILDVDTLTWTTGTIMPVLRGDTRATMWNNKIYLIGGTTNQTASTGATGGQTQGKRYDPIANTWLTDTQSIFRTLTTARVNANVECYNGMIFYWEGISTAAPNSAIVNTGYYYNILTNTETAIGTNPTANCGISSAFYHKDLDDGRELNYIFSIGGGTIGVGDAIPNANLTFAAGNNIIWIMQLPSYGALPNWVQLSGYAGVLNVNRAFAGAECYGDYVYIFGGVYSGSAVTTSIEKLNVNNGDFNQAWQTTGLPTLITARYGFGITKPVY